MTRSRQLLLGGLLASGLATLAAWWLLRPSPSAPEPKPHLLRVIERGVVRVATVNSPVTYFNVQDRETGFEYELAREFAAALDVRLEMVVVDRYQDLFTALATGTADVAAASITITPARARLVEFGPVYQEVRQQVIYRSGRKRPATIEALSDRRLEVIAGSSYEQTLERLAETIPELTWGSVESGTIEQLFEAIVDDELDATLADSNIMAVHRRFYPELRIAFSLDEVQRTAWAFPRGDDPTLRSAAKVFFAQLRDRGRLERLRERYQAHLPGFDRVNTHYFRRHIAQRLPPLDTHFKLAAQRTGFDWKLLAAMAYQESHWDPDAVSPTGVRGIMMLTLATAGELGVSDRENPRESILAGARYLAKMRAKIPARIEEPDRTWLALAAYNVGWGHLEDARILTQRAGRNPDRWQDVAEQLPRLSDPEVYRGTRFGYAHGREPVRYVRNIRSYYDILTWSVGRGNMAANGR